MTAHECLLHPWLTGDHSKWTNPIANSRYLSIRDRLRAKYENWDKYVLPIGRLAEYSSLRKLLIEKYRIYDSCFGEYQNECTINFYGRSIGNTVYLKEREETLTTNRLSILIKILFN